MKLTLILQNPPPEAASTATFVMHDGSAVIGRDPSCEWTLPDPHSEVSRRHASIRFTESGYWLEDLNSLNGVVLDANDMKVGRDQPYRLKSGDLLRIGDYRVRVTVEASSRDRSDRRVTGARDRDVIPNEIDPVEQRFNPARPAPAPWENRKLPSQPEPPMRVPDAHFAPPAVHDPEAAVPDGPGMIPDDWDKSRSVIQVLGTAREAPAPNSFDRGRTPIPEGIPSEFREMPGSRPAGQREDRDRAAGGGQRAYAPVAARGSDSASMVRLLAAAGIQAPGDDELGEQIGKVLRVAAQGIMDLLRARAEVKYQFRMETTVFQARGNNPLKFAATADQAFDQLFANRDARNLPPVEAVAAGIDDLKWHQLALIAGMRHAILEVIRSFDPAVLKARFEQDGGGRPGAFGWSGGQKLWEQYEAMFAAIRADVDGYFKREFGEAFVEEYERQVGELERKHGSRSTAGRR